MSDDLLQELLKVFEEESGALLEGFESALEGLRRAPPPATDPTWREVERLLHTLKGASEAVGAQAVAGAAHQAEDQLAHFAQDGGEPLSLIAALEDHAAGLRASVAVFLADPLAPPATSLPADSPGAAQEPTASSAAASSASTEASTEASSASTEASSASTEASRAATEASSARIPPSVARPPAPRPARSGGIAALRASADVLRVKPERVDDMHGLVGELAVTRRRFSDVGVELRDVRRALSQALRSWRGLKGRIQTLRKPLAAGARYGLDQSTEAMGGQLVALQRQLTAIGRHVHSLEAQAAATSQALEDGIQELRLMALEPFLELFGPSVREAAETAGCSAQLVVEARGTEVDRLVLLKLRDPLLHLVRNAVAHGIEPPAERRAAGKPEVGTVRLEAETEGDRARIRVTDDGRGVNVAGVRAKAIQAGLCADGESLDEARLLELLLAPGLSSKDSVDSLSGRGIGMDVVGDVIRSLDGQLTLTNRPGEGCTFSLEVPISTSAGRGLIMRCGDALFGFLSHGVERVLRLDPGEVRSLHGQSTVLMGQTPVALSRLDALLGLPAAVAPPDEKLICVVLRQGAQRLALVVDEVFREDEFQVKPLGEAFAGASLFLGGAIQADGKVVPVLRAAACLTRGGALPGYRPPPAASRAASQVLVVDDSLTMRTMLRNILQGAGYEVFLAKDGRDALDALERIPDCALLLTDLEMPVMDGFQLCAAVRSGERPNLPVLVISSLAAPSEIERALEAGADAYVVKADLRQTTFLERVAGLTGRVAP